MGPRPAPKAFNTHYIKRLMCNRKSIVKPIQLSTLAGLALMLCATVGTQPAHAQGFETMLALMDKDGDGGISQAEFFMGNEQFSRLDMNGDGIITEADGGIDAPTPAGKLGQMDADGDGLLTPDEFAGNNTAFTKLDNDGDGLLSREEMIAADANEDPFAHLVDMRALTAGAGIDREALFAARDAGDWDAVRALARAAGVDPEAVKGARAETGGNGRPEVGSRLNMDAIYDVERLLRASAAEGPQAGDAGLDSGLDAGLSGLSTATDAVDITSADPISLGIAGDAIGTGMADTARGGGMGRGNSGGHGRP